MSEPTEAQGNVGVAFALVIGAGASTGIGAAVVFFPSLVRLANRRTLAAALGLSAGVMCYVSFVEIFQKAYLSFLDAGHPDNMAYIYATLCFFSGVVIMMLLNYAVTALLGGHKHSHNIDRPSSEKRLSDTEAQDEAVPTSVDNNGEANAACVCCADDPVGDLDNVQRMATEIDEFENRKHEAWDGEKHDNPHPHQHTHEDGNKGEKQDDVVSDDSGDDELSHSSSKVEQKKLMTMSVNTALAIGLHNFPEGLATFVAALADPKVGAVLAVAIAIHNIPEGLCVALPIYYATGNKWKAFGWACLSGVAEPVAALLGWAILATVFNNTVYAILFGTVAGMMIIISVKELLPTAHRYDPDDTVVTYSFILGMAIMALSLTLFVL